MTNVSAVLFQAPLPQDLEAACPNLDLELQKRLEPTLRQIQQEKSHEFSVKKTDLPYSDRYSEDGQ